MNQSMQKPLWATTAMAAIGLALLAGCEKKTTTVDTPAATTTSASPSASAGQMMSKAGDAIVDSAVTAKVKTAFLADPDVKGLQIDVDTKDGVVTLNGAVTGAGNVERAATIAKGIDGVKSVDNKLTVR